MRFIGLSPDQDRALHELYQGRAIRLTGDELPGALVCWAIDTALKIDLQPGGYAILTPARAQRLGLETGQGQADDAVALSLDPGGGADQLTFLMQSNTQVQAPMVPAPKFASALLNLAKQGRLIPAFYIRPERADEENQTLSQFDVAALALRDVPQTVRRISRVPLPIKIHDQSLQTEATLYEVQGMQENPVVLTIGNFDQKTAPLVRLHSACLTGDVFGSLRCDCGPQLHQALLGMQAAGGGGLLYLPQEGRDTGLKNKLRAYALQDAGLDTIEADATLGFDADERDFAMAAALLRDLGIKKLRLMTNNPEKVTSLQDQGLIVTARVPLEIPAQRHNHAYLKTKAQRAGHQLSGLKG